MRSRLLPALALAVALFPATAHADVSVTDGTLRITSSEAVEVVVGDIEGRTTVRSSPALPVGSGCTAAFNGHAICQTATRLDATLSSADDSLQVLDPVTATVKLGAGNDRVDVPAPSIIDAGAGADYINGSPGVDRVDGGAGNDQISGEAGRDSLRGDSGRDRLWGGAGDDVITSGSGRDELDSGDGRDRINTTDRIADTVFCGRGADRLRADVVDTLDLSCDRVSYGPPGRIRQLYVTTARTKFVPIPGQGRARIDRWLLPNVLYLIRKYKVRVSSGYARHGHNPSGEHPIGLAVDLEPGPGGSCACRPSSPLG